MKNEYMKYAIVMILCFLFGGFSIMLFLYQVYGNIWASEVFSGNQMNFTNSSQNFTSSPDMNRSPPRDRVPLAQMGLLERISSPLSLMLFLNGIILLAGGVSLWHITREKEITKAKENLTSLLLLPEEKIILEEIRKSHGNMTQSMLVKKTGMNKVKVHRIIRKLAAKGIISKHEYGLTNKIVLVKDF